MLSLCILPLPPQHACNPESWHKVKCTSASYQPWLALPLLVLDDGFANLALLGDFTCDVEHLGEYDLVNLLHIDAVRGRRED